MATQQAPSLPWPIAETRSTMQAHRESGYLKALLQLTERRAEAAGDSLVRSTYLDVLATTYAYVGAEQLAMQTGDAAFPRKPQPFGNEEERAAFLASVRAAPAISTIVEASAGRRFVMINEEHRSSRQRAFANELLEPLRKAGFTHLALETLTEDPAALAERGYPTMGSGIYTVDPLLGDLVRQALALGFAVLGYEASADERRPRPDDASPLAAINRREAGQARRLFEQTLGADPDARVLVYAGRDHIAEAEADGWTPMGLCLAKLADTDPLTINLMAMTEHSDREFEHRAYRAVEEAGWLDEGPILLKGLGGELWSDAPGVFDAYGLMPRTQRTAGRPDWAQLGGARLPERFEPPAQTAPLLLQALVAGEQAHPVPADQVVWWPGQPVPRLLLRPGRYVLRAVDGDGAVVAEELRTIERAR